MLKTRLKLLQRVIQKTAEATGDLIGNKNADKITKVSKNAQQNNLESVTNENDKDIYFQKKGKKLLMIWE